MNSYCGLIPDGAPIFILMAASLAGLFGTWTAVNLGVSILQFKIGSIHRASSDPNLPICHFEPQLDLLAKFSKGIPVKWEIDKAVDLRKKIVAVKTAKDNVTPSNLYNVGAKWALSFTFKAIKEALDGA